MSKSYGDVLALDQITLQVEDGEIYGLIGPNGAGKTTTIKLLVGLLRPSSGQVFVNGFDVQKDGLAAKKELGYIPDEPFLYGRLTPLELMDFKGSLHNMARKDLEKQERRASAAGGPLRSPPRSDRELFTRDEAAACDLRCPSSRSLDHRG